MLLAIGQRLLNEQIRASTAARARVEALEGKRFAVSVTDSDLRFVAAVVDGTLQLSYAPADECDVELTAGMTDLLRLARSANLSALRESGATLQGDPAVAEAFAELFRFATPELESVLGDRIGDVAAHAIGEAARRSARFGQRTAAALGADVAEYLQEEQPTLVPPALAREFGAEVERLRDDVERAGRRIEMLERRLRQRTGPA